MESPWDSQEMLSTAYAHSSSSDGLDVDLEVATGSLGMVESSEEERRVFAARISNKRKAKRAPLLSNPPFQQAKGEGESSGTPDAPQITNSCTNLPSDTHLDHPVLPLPPSFLTPPYP
ncbi:hypothetical protein GH714_007143 [Hevea brasiliensis]|uniref:Uncharacterized protein n=1 Tax=Hevea brasiliensis TaxID=3981 RepID=A0A6A6N1H6_HEVBR|nr:hypothetical protein GH714_007143 [Hevea brasiliensis]